MSQPRFYCPEALTAHCHYALPTAVARHAVKVLRLQVGDSLVLFNGQGGEFPAVIRQIQREQVSVEIGAWQAIERESPLQIRLLQALQVADKMDFTIQKAVELGVSSVVPIQSRRSVLKLEGDRASKRLAHWQGIMVAACEQCGRNRVPELAPIQTLPRFFGNTSTEVAETATEHVGKRLRLVLAPGSPLNLSHISDVQHIDLLVGAEGGLDPDEIALAQQHGFQAVSLGPRILRTETAGLAAIAVLQALGGDLRG